MLGRITAKINELWKPPARTVERGREALQQADNYQKNQQFEQALSSLNTAKAALKHGVRCGREAESRPVLGEVYQKQAELWQRQKDFDVDVVRERYRKALEYFSDPAQKAAVQEMLDLLPGAHAPDTPQIKRHPTLPPSSVPPPTPIISTGIPAPFFVDPATPPASDPSHPSYALVEPDEITDTQHLAWCLQQTDCDGSQLALQKELSELVSLIIQKFKTADKTLACMQEAAALATIPRAESYGLLIDHTLKALDPKHVINITAVQGLVVIVRNCPATLLKKEGGIRAALWTKVLQVLMVLLDDIHKDDPVPVQELLQGISQLLDAMVQAGVTGISRTKLQQPLYKLLRDEKTLNPKNNIALSWQMHYACEALAYIPNDESTMDSVLRCLFAVGKGVGSLAKAIKGVDTDSLMQSFGNLHEAFTAAQEFVSSAAKFNELKEAIQNVLEVGDSFEEAGADIQNRQRRTGWYVALQCMEPLIQANQLEKFEKLVRESAYRQDANFLQGVCQCLERLVCTQKDKAVQEKAIQFLQSLRDDTVHWVKEERVLSQVTSFMFKSGVTRVKEHAEDALKRLEARTAPLSESDNVYVPPAWDPVWEKRPPTKLLEAARRKLTIPLEEQLLKSLYANIQKLQTMYLTGLQQDNEIRDALAHYVPPDGVLMTALNYDAENRFNLNEKVRDFLGQDTKQVLLLLGEAGLGKSTFNRHLVCSLWEAYTTNPDNDPVPVFIALSGIKSSSGNLVTAFFESQGFSREQIEMLRATRRLVFILDGFDEIKQPERAFYTDNQLGDWPKAKVIITSRPEYLGRGYQSKFHPSGRPEILQEYQLAPFSEKLIGQYVEKYAEAYPESLWTAEQYKEVLKKPDLSALVSNPLLLKMALSVLSKSKEGQLAQEQRFTRIALYDQFVKNWFDLSKKRLERIQLPHTQREEFRRMDSSDFARFGVRFSKEFAKAQYRAGEVATTYVAADYAFSEEEGATSQQPDWRKRFLSDDNPKYVLMRLNAPLIRQGDQYRFIHKSIRDYFVARALLEPGQAQQEVSKEALFNQLNLVKDPAVLGFLAERVEPEPKLKEQLFTWIDASKRNTEFQTAAANALSILVRARVPLSGRNFNGIHAGGADLSYGVFDHTQFEGADLSRVNFQGAWLREANLRGANLTGISFGQGPILKVEDDIRACCYSPDGSWLAVGIGEVQKTGRIQLYQAETLEFQGTFEGHTGDVTSVTFSPNGKWLASGSTDNTVKLWLVAKRRLVGTFGEPVSLDLINSELFYPSGVISMAFSRDSQWLASGSRDRTVKLWSLEEDRLRLQHTFEGHQEEVNSVTFSPDDKWLTSSSRDNTVKLWSVAERRLLRTLEGHLHSVESEEFSPHRDWGPIGMLLSESELEQIIRWRDEGMYSVTFSPDSKWLASGSYDHEVMLWRVETDGVWRQYTFKEHTGCVNNVTFSPDGRWLASGSRDKTVKLWSVKENGLSLQQTFEGHQKEVNSVMFSSDSQYLVSSDFGKEIRLWSIETNKRGLRPAFEGHSAEVKSVAFSPDGKWLASGSMDNTVKLWSVAMGSAELKHTFTEHPKWVTSVAFSPDGKWLASGSGDTTVRLWSVEPDKPEGWGLVHTFKGHTDFVQCVTFSPDDGLLLASGSMDKTVKLWSVAADDRRLLSTIRGHIRDLFEVDNVTFSPDGKWLAWSTGGEVSLLMQTDNTPIIFKGHPYITTSMTFSPNSKWLASSSLDKAIKLWSMELEPETFLQGPTLEGHTDSVRCVMFSPNGKWLASGSDDETVRIWSVDTGECLAVIKGFVGPVFSVAWQKSPESKALLATSGLDKAVRLWQVEPHGNSLQIRLRWTSHQAALTAAGMNVENALGLSPQNTSLLKQLVSNSKEKTVPPLDLSQNPPAYPVHHAVEAGNIDLLKAILSDNEININQLNKDNKTALHIATQNNKIKMMQVLIEKGANVDARDSQQRTPLHYAADMGNAKATTILFYYGASYYVVDKDENTPLDLADVKNHIQVMRIIADKMSNIKIRAEHHDHDSKKVNFLKLQSAIKSRNSQAVLSLLKDEAYTENYSETDKKIAWSEANAPLPHDQGDKYKSSHKSMQQDDFQSINRLL